ncbi:centromere protein S isoform X2 [Protopterus annectens]|uniref:centromere protein S isoform X2 n=1 Tax=Protopterus annectens TaxID=7888 RepID=UPI001CFA0174|nr:centromere protein S isoform X2 [Protopterus annectens]
MNMVSQGVLLHDNGEPQRLSMDLRTANVRERLKAAVHYTVGCLTSEVAEDVGLSFSKRTIAAIAETTFRQCEQFARDLEMFARHAKRSTVNTDDVKLVARRSQSLYNFISEKCDQLTANNQEQKERKKKKSSSAMKGVKSSDIQSESVVQDEDSNMA